MKMCTRPGPAEIVGRHPPAMTVAAPPQVTRARQTAWSTAIGIRICLRALPKTDTHVAVGRAWCVRVVCTLA